MMPPLLILLFFTYTSWLLPPVLAPFFSAAIYLYFYFYLFAYLLPRVAQATQPTPKAARTVNMRADDLPPRDDCGMNSKTRSVTPGRGAGPVIITLVCSSHSKLLKWCINGRILS